MTAGFFTALTGISFLNPWLLLTLLGLPALWLFLKVTPPPPKHLTFPAVMLLAGLFNKNQSSDKAPWWLIALRLSLITIFILIFAHPQIHQDQPFPEDGPVLLIIENDWAAGQNWSALNRMAEIIIEDSAHHSREIYLALPHQLDEEGQASFMGPLTASAARDYLQQLSPSPVMGNYQALARQLAKASFDVSPVIIWLQTGLRPTNGFEFEKQLLQTGPVYLYQPESYNLPVILNLSKDGLAEPSGIQVSVERPQINHENRGDHEKIPAEATEIPREITLSIHAGDGRLLGQQLIQFGDHEFEKSAPLNIPENLVSEISKISLDGQHHAGGVFLLDSRWGRTGIGILQPEGEDGLPLLSENHYLGKASSELGHVSIAPLAILLRVQIGVMIMPDAVMLSQGETEALQNWVEKGGVLIRFAGRNLARHADKDPLLPVDLRYGGRALDGMLQWEKPAKLKNFSKESPLAGLKIPDEVLVSQQVLSATNTNMKQQSWAQLEDGTSLISGKKQGKGWLVLFHTTANTDWSNLVLSGIFPEILERLTRLSFVSSTDNPDAPEGADGTEGAEATEVMEGGVENTALPYYPLKIINGKGQVVSPPENLEPLDLTRPLQVGGDTPPGLYERQGQTLALNLAPNIHNMEIYRPDSTAIEKLAPDIAKPVEIKPALLVAGFILIIIDMISSLALRGQLPGPGLLAKPVYLFIFILLGLPLVKPAPLSAEEEIVAPITVAPLMAPQSNPVDSGTGLAYVMTGNDKVDRISREGLSGLVNILNQRTAIEATTPVGLDLAKSELSFYPLIYWPITGEQRNLTQSEIDNVNNYLSYGGSILFDSRSPEHSNASMLTHLQRLTEDLNIPPLVPLDTDHVLTKSFYLLQDFPGRWQGGKLWAEPLQAGTADGVSRVMVGQNDWAGAWAVDEYGRPRFPVIPGGEVQREMAYRFGVNLMMYMLTGNYKKDQVHLPAILERLGQ